MSWRDRIATVVLFVLAALPIARTACALGCSSSGSIEPHHGSSQACAQSESSSQIESEAPDGCGTHDAAMTQIATAATERAEAGKSTAAFVPVNGTAFAIPPAGPSTFDQSSPPGTAPPTSLPVVLRV